MTSVKTLVTMKRAGVYHPPGSIFHDFDPDEAEALGPRRVVILSRDDGPSEPEGSLGPEIVPPPAVELPNSVPGAPDDASPGAPVPAQAPGGETSRVAEIMEAIDLLDEPDFTAAGRPKVKPLSDVLGFKPTSGEIEAAMQMRESLA